MKYFEKCFLRYFQKFVNFQVGYFKVKNFIVHISEADFPANRQTDADNNGCRERCGEVVYQGADPGERHRRVYHPAVKFVLGPDRMHNFEVALESDGGQVDRGTRISNPNEVFANKKRAQQVSTETGEVYAADLHGMGFNSEKRT